MLYNLARAWRSKTFDEIIGQDLAVRLVKNSLYRGQLFPVYLLAGQRGCGKTTMGRVFAAAVNCQRLVDFQQQPQTVSLPCLVCSSCRAMQQGNHPDFIEIDAASNTGVDNVRALIEAASYLPVIGRKKIYLIDEAHMLSKAAFNAFLKILEEPPHTALFMLATTDIHKIIDTVRSRCFQLFFQPVPGPVLVEHLQAICKKEQIAYDLEGLQTIVQESEGSVRDALNCIERVRLAYDGITKDAVGMVLGLPSDDHMLMFFEALITSEMTNVLTMVKQWYDRGYQPRSLWKRLVELIRACLLMHHGVELLHYQPFALHKERLKTCIRACSLEHIVRLWEFCFEIESLLSKTTMVDALVELLVVKMAQLRQTNVQAVSTNMKDVSSPRQLHQGSEEQLKNVSQNHEASPVPAGPSSLGPVSNNWTIFLAELDRLDDPLVRSMFQQAKLTSWHEKNIEVIFPAKFVFFKDMLASTERIWKAAMEKISHGPVTFAYHFEESAEEVITPPRSQQVEPLIEKQVIPRQSVGTQRHLTTVVDVRDPEKYPQAQALLKVFPGTIYEKQDKNT